MVVKHFSDVAPDIDGRQALGIIEKDGMWITASWWGILKGWYVNYASSGMRNMRIVLYVDYSIRHGSCWLGRLF